MTRSLLIAIAALSIAAPSKAHADDVSQIVAVLAAEGLPAGLGVAEVHLPPALASLDVAPDAVTVSWPSTPHAGRASARVTIGSKKAWVQITIAAMTQVAVATRALAAGETIGAADIRRDNRAAGRTAAALPTVIGATTTVAIAAGDVVDKDAIAPAAPVARGAEITVRIHHGNFTATAHGTLDRAARPGDAAAVHLANRTLVHGVLVDAATVEIGAAP